MAQVTVAPITNRSIWEKFLASQSDASFLQSWNWGEFHRQLHHKILRLGFYHHKHLLGISLLIHQPARRGSHLECPGGPLISNWDNQTLVRAIFAAVADCGRQLNVSFIRLRPQLPESTVARDLFHRLGCYPAPTHLHAETTWQLDLTQPEETILHHMRKSTRYLIKKAQKDGVTVTQTQDLKFIDTLYQLQLETVKRHQFVPFSQEFLTRQFAVFAADNQTQLFLAKYRGKIIAAAMIIFYGSEAVYHYSGSSQLARHIPASYALQWAAIQEAKRRGLNRYNFWGIAPDNNPHHRFAGVTLFKTGFGGHRVDYLHAHDLPLRSSYWLTWLFETLRAKYRRL